uniref:TPR_REGION domain-containing protein n=1 Tax=Schistosoma mansoni TaxID=6183 RepID=A0A5K4FDR2_SCHMA
MDETQVGTFPSKSKQHNDNLTSTVLTHRIQANLNVLKCKLGLDLVNKSRLYQDKKDDFAFNESKPFVLKFIEQKNKLFRSQVNLEKINDAHINTMSQDGNFSIEKRRSLPKLKHTDHSLAIIPKTGTVNKLPTDYQVKQRKQLKYQANYPNTNSNLLKVDKTKKLPNLIKLDPIEEIVVSDYQDGDFTTTGIQGQNKFDYSLIKNTTNKNTMKKKDPTNSISEKVPVACSNTTKKCCTYGIREPIEPWFPLDSLFIKSNKMNQKVTPHLRLNRSKSCDTKYVNNFKLPFKSESRLYHSSPNLMNQSSGDLVINQNFSSLLNELTQQRKLILDMEDQTASNLEENISPGYCTLSEDNKILTIIHSNDDGLVHPSNHVNDLETSYHIKSVNMVGNHGNKIDQYLNNQPISIKQFIHLNSSDLLLLLLSPKINNDKNHLQIDWNKIIQKLPKNIESILEYFGSTKQDQFMNIKLVINEIENLTQEINRNSSTRLGFDLCRRGALYRKIGRLQDAKADLLRSIQLESKLSSAHWNIHFIYLLEGKTKEALYHLEQSFIYSILNDSIMEMKIWTKLIDYNPTYELAYEKRANLYLKLKMYHQAYTDFMKILNLNPKSFNAQFQCGLYKFHMKDWRKAVTYFQMVLVHNPSHYEARYYLARCLLKLFNYNKALAELTTSLYYQPIYYKALFTRGCLLTKACPLQSLRDLTLCIYIGNKKYQTMALIQRGLILYQLKKYKMALNDFQTVLTYNVDHLYTDVYRLIGLTYIQLNQPNRAIEVYTEGINKQIIPNINILLCRSEAYYQLNQFNKAIFDIQRVIHLSPHLENHYLLFANYLHKLANTQLVQHSIQQYLSLAESEKHKQVEQMALAYYYLNRYKEAEIVLLEDLKHQPVFNKTLLLGLILDKQNKTKDSIELLINSLKQLRCTKSEKAEIYNHLGQYYMKIGNYLSAIHAFTTFIQYNPHRPHVYLYRAQSACRLIALQHQGETILPDNFNDNVLDDISQALVLIHSNKSSVNPIHFNGPIKYVNIIDQCLLTRIIYFGINQRYTKAILNCNEVIHRRPEWTRIWIYRGVFKYLLKTYDFCEADLNIAIEKDQRSSLAYYHRGLCHQIYNKWDEAIEDYHYAIQYGTLYGSIQLYSFINRSIIYMEKYQDYHKAINDLYQAKMIMDKFMNSTHDNENNETTKVISELLIKLMYTIGICHQRLEMYTKAGQILHHLTIQQPNFLKGHIAYANCLMDYEGYNIKMGINHSMKLWNQALSVYEFALKMDELNLEASIGLSMCLQVLGRLNDALKQITHTLNIYYDYQESNSNEFIGKKQTSSSEDHNRLLADAYDCRAIIYLQLGRPQCAIDDLTTAIRLNHYSAKYLVNRGVAYFRNHQLMPAMIDFKNAIQLDSTNHLAYYHQSLIYLHHGQIEQSETIINILLNYNNQSICLDPSSWLLRSIIRLIKYQSKNSDHHDDDDEDQLLKEALNDIHQAEQLILPKLNDHLTCWPHLHYTKGQILYQLKKYKEAEEEFTKALSLLPSNKYFYEIRCKCREEMYRTGLSNSYENVLTDYRLSLLANDVTIQ